MKNVFTYGTLMSKQVMYALVKQQNYETVKGTLKNYSRRHVKERIYPGLIVDPGNEVQGILYKSVTEEDVAILDNFEGAEYKATEVRIQTDKGEYEAVAYVYGDPKNLEQTEWDPREFEEKEKNHFAEKHLSGEL